MASDDEINHGFITAVLGAGDYTIRYSWINDKYAPDQGFDANILIDSVFFDKLVTIHNPEPTTMVLLSAGLLAFTAMARRRKSSF